MFRRSKKYDHLYESSDPLVRRIALRTRGEYIRKLRSDAYWDSWQSTTSLNFAGLLVIPCLFAWRVVWVVISAVTDEIAHHVRKVRRISVKDSKPETMDEPRYHEV